MSLRTKLLIVDDHPTNIDIFKCILDPLDEYIYKVTLSGEEAFTVLGTYNPDIILLDIMMPGMDGYEVCKTIRSNENFRFIKIIMVSAKTRVEERLKAYEVGADDYITKPFDEDELIAKLNVFKKLKRAEEVEQIQSNLIAILSHEIRTPLSGIMGAAEIFQLDNSFSNEQQKMLDILINSVNKLVSLVERVFFLCNLKSELTLNFVPILCKDFINNSILSLYELIKEKNLKITVDCDDSLKLLADLELLNDAIKTLLENAIDYSPVNESIDIKVEKGKRYCSIKIKDNGEGIHEDRISSIFEMFSMKDVKHHHKGLGLNLSIARLVVEHHKGFLDVESKPGQGATFKLKLPVYEN